MPIETQAAPAGQVKGLVDHLFRSAAGQMVSYLARLLGPEHLDLAEEVVQEALLKALQRWPHTGVPDNPAGWLLQVARNAALDAVRRKTRLAHVASQIEAEIARAQVRSEPADMASELRDDEIRMIFMCCHPALSQDARVALSLKTVGGFSVQEIARAFLADEATVAQRIVRAKRQIRELGLRLELPAGNELEARVDSLLEVLYLMFNEGYAAHSGEDLVRQELCGEALRLARLLASSPLASPKVHALVALLAFQGARLPARTDANGEMVLLEDQDRSLWDRVLVGLGFHHLERAAEGDRISEYHLQAAIASVHSAAIDAASTDWHAILSLYDQLMAMFASPIVALNRAVALGRVEGSGAALEALDRLASEPALKEYYLLPAVRGRLLMDMGQRSEAATEYVEALARSCSLPERRFLEHQLARCRS